MSFDRDALIEACASHGTVARVVVAAVRGSAPREVGASMLVWTGGQSGTIGGGTLEFEAARHALTGGDRLRTHALGPDMGQCCGGAVTLLTEIYDLERARAVPDDIVARGPQVGSAPLPVARVLAQARNGAHPPEPRLIDGWMIEPVTPPRRALWIWGAGHVGRAIVDVMQPLPDVAITWVDTHADRLPAIPPGVTQVPAADPVRLVPHAPKDAQHLILTYSHTLDLELCDALLRRGFDFAGLIGSATKWARFRSRLRQYGHTDTTIARITCPIGTPQTGKHPHAIAIGVAGQLQALAQPLKQSMKARA